MKRFDVPERWQSTMALVSEVTEADLEQHFTAAERAWLGDIRSERKRLDSAAARLALKILVRERQLCSDLRDCEIFRAGAAPTILIGGSAIPFFLSLSHSEGFGAGAIDVEPLGIDIQLLRTLDPRTAKFFLHDDEADEVPAGEHAFLHLWCAKEAALKASAPAGSTLKAVRLHYTGERGDALHFTYSAGGKKGIIETTITADSLLIAVAWEKYR
jgi:phosphopantetheinyl transferase